MRFFPPEAINPEQSPAPEETPHPVEAPEPVPPESEIPTHADYVFELFGEGLRIKQYKGGNVTVVVPDAVEGKTILSIGPKAFLGKPIRSIKLPKTITDLGDEAFAQCEMLTSVGLGNALTKISKKAFMDCPKLRSIVLPKSLLEIGESAFAKSGIESIGLPPNVKKIAWSAFLGATSLKQITVDPLNKVYCSLDDILFTKDMSKLLCYPSAHPGSSYQTPAPTKTIGEYAFASAMRLNSITLSQGVTSIGTGAFDNAHCLTEVHLSTTLESIGANAFKHCSALSTILIPLSVTTIGNNAFDYDSKLKIRCKAKSKPSGWSDKWNVGVLTAPKWGSWGS